MNREIRKELNQILKNTSNELSWLNKKIRQPFNKKYSLIFFDFLDKLLDARLFAISGIISLILFYVLFFYSLFIGESITGSELFSIFIPIFITLKIIKAVKKII